MANIHRCVLVVDDDVDTLNLVKRVLERDHFNVFTAVSCEEALDLIATRGLPHLAVVDLRFPNGMSGFQFCEEVHKTSPLPIIILTSTDDESTIVEGISKYAEDYMTKPFRPFELVMRVRRVLLGVRDLSYAKCP